MLNLDGLPYHALVLMGVVVFAYGAKILCDSNREREATRKILRDRYRFLEDPPDHNRHTHP